MTLNDEHKNARALLMHPMSERDFQSFIERSIAGYAQDLERTYRYNPAGAVECAVRNVDALLPQGFATAGHTFFNLCCDAQALVGWLWLEVRSEEDETKTLFICDLEIHDAFRRQGWGRRALMEVEKWALERGIYRVELNVFADNDAALALYRAGAFDALEITMGKNLG